MTKLTKEDKITDLYMLLANDTIRLVSALADCYSYGRLAEAESLLDELSVITRFLNYSRNVIE